MKAQGVFYLGFRPFQVHFCMFQRRRSKPEVRTGRLYARLEVQRYMNGEVGQLISLEVLVPF